MSTVKLVALMLKENVLPVMKLSISLQESAQVAKMKIVTNALVLELANVILAKLILT